MFKDELVKLMGLIEVYENNCKAIEQYGVYPLSNANAYYIACRNARLAYEDIIKTIKTICGSNEGFISRVVINSMIDGSLECSMWLDTQQVEIVAEYINANKYIEIEW
jgi:hypothetical protein